MEYIGNMELKSEKSCFAYVPSLQVLRIFLYFSFYLFSFRNQFIVYVNTSLQVLQSMFFNIRNLLKQHLPCL